MTELEKLIRQQQADDTDVITPEKDDNGDYVVNSSTLDRFAESEVKRRF